MRLTDFSDPWVEQLTRQGRIADDPVLLASERSMTPFAWSHLDHILPLTARYSVYMAQARAGGLAECYAVPGQASGRVSFVIVGGRELPADTLPAAQYLACFAFEAARHLKLADQGKSARGGIRLTQRQLDCVVLAARGKYNWVAGRLLGLSAGTVHKYLEAAKHR